MRKEIIITKDGSHSIYLPEMDEHYHSTNGSITESEHIFIQMGLAEITRSKQDINILEVGMGSGLNVLTTAMYVRDLDLTVNYLGLEAYPLDWELLKELNYAETLKGESVKGLFKKMHDLPWNKPGDLYSNLILTKCNSKIQEVEFTKEFDLVYFDAFAPDKQEEMWSEALFLKIFNSMSSNSILVTYCVKGIIRRRLQALGFSIEKLPGPLGGKREMLRARKM